MRARMLALCLALISAGALGSTYFEVSEHFRERVQTIPVASYLLVFGLLCVVYLRKSQRS